MAALCCTMFMSVKAAPLADGVQITIGTTAVDSDNKDNILDAGIDAGTASYNDVTHVLLLENFEMDGAAAIVIDASALTTDGVAIQIKGSCYLRSSAGDPIWFKGGLGLSIFGDAEANLTVRATGSDKASALLVAKNHTTSDPDEFFNLSIYGGLWLYLDNYMADEGYPTLVCKNMDLNQSSMSLTGYKAESKLMQFAGGKNYNKLTKVSEIDDFDEGYAYFVPFENAFPVWVDGYQMTDGLIKDEADYVIGADKLSYMNGSVKYNPATRTVRLSGWFSLQGKNESADAVLRIYDDASTEPIKVIVEGGSPAKIASVKSGVAGLRVESPVEFDINGYNVQITTNSAASAPAVFLSEAVTFKNSKCTDFPDRTLTIYADHDNGIYGTGTATVVTIDRCEASLYGFYNVVDGIQDLVLNHVKFKDAYTFSTTKNTIVDGSDVPVENKTVDINISDWTLTVAASPATGGSVGIYDGSLNPLDNPYTFDADGSAKLAAVENTGYLFAGWFNNWGSKLSEDNPYDITLTAGYNESVVGRFSHTVETEEPWFILPEGSASIYKFGDKFRGTDTYVGELPLTSGYTFRLAAYAGGKVYYTAYDGMWSKNALYAASFDGTTIGSMETIVDMQDEFLPFISLAYNPSEEVFYGFATQTSDYSTQLIKIDPAAATDKITALADMSSIIGTDLKGIAINNSGEAYVLSGMDELWTLDLSGFTATLVGHIEGLSFSSPGATGIAFDPTTEELFITQSTTMGCDVYIVDPSNAKSEWISTHIYFMSVAAIFSTTEPVVGNKFEITVKVKAGDEAKGKVTPSGTVKVKEGKSLNMKATANKGYLFDQWNDGDTNADRTITPTADATYEASFKDDPDMKIYPILVGGVELYSGATTITYPSAEFPALTAGAIVFDAEKNILTLNAANIDVTGALNALTLGAAGASGELTVVIVGDCKISAVADAIKLSDFGTVTFKGEGVGAKLTINSNAIGINTDESDLTINGLETVIVASGKGIAGTTAETLTVDGANLQVKGTAGSITDLGALETPHCSLASGYDFVPADNAVKKGGAVATDNVTFDPWKAITVTPVEKGSGHFTLTGDVNGETFTDKGFFEKDEKVTIEAVAEDGFTFGHWTDDAQWKDAEKRMGTTHDEITMGTTDKNLSALFYAVPATSATWYGINNGKVVSFSFDDNCEEGVNPKKAITVSGVKAGDFVEGEWYVLDGTNLKSWAFEGGFDKDTELDTETQTVAKSAPSGITDIAYDLMEGDSYAVAGKDLYKVNTTDSKFEKIGTFKYKDADVAVTCIAIDGSSTKYVLGTGSEGVLYTVEEIDEEGKKVKLAIVGKEADGGKIGVAVSGDAQSMAFDHVSGDLIWGAPDYIRIISTEDAKAHIAGDLGQKAGSQGVIKGLHRMDVTVYVQVAVAEGCEEMGTVSIGTGSKTKVAFVEGTSATLVATPAEGYKFLKWTVASGKSEKDFKNNENATVTVSAGNNKYFAYFEKKDDEGFENINVEGNARKVMVDGTIYIVRENGIFTITGARVK